MMARRILVLVLSVLLSTVSFPAHADTHAINFCANKSDGRVHPITTGKCGYGEYTLGAHSIAIPQTRPHALLPTVLFRFWSAQAAAKRVGVYLKITSGYRTLEDQAYLFKRAVKKYGSAAKASKWVLPPQYSTHPWGVALDVNFRTTKKASAQWLEINGYKWGLCRVYDNEWWHFEGITTPGKKCPKRWKNAVERFPNSVK
jgi:D-alanyl-D-alanine carboxypeptidase